MPSRSVDERATQRWATGHRGCHDDSSVPGTAALFPRENDGAEQGHRDGHDAADTDALQGAAGEQHGQGRSAGRDEGAADQRQQRRLNEALRLARVVDYAIRLRVGPPRGKCSQHALSDAPSAVGLGKVAKIERGCHESWWSTRSRRDADRSR